MKVCALLGFPLAHSVTPAMYAPALATMGIDARCEKWVTPPEELAERVRALRARDVLGANVTVPHKEAVIPLMDELDASAEAIGAVNCIHRLPSGALRGHNTDKYGFIRSLREAGFEPEGRRTVLLGAGGAARAVALALVEAGIRQLTIANRSRDRADALAAVLGARARAVDWRGPELDEACASANLLVNSTPMGTAHTDLAALSPAEPDHFHPGMWAYDLVYNPPETPFLALAEKADAKVIGGLEMLVYQGAESLRIFTGREPPVDVMRRAARQALVQP